MRSPVFHRAAPGPASCALSACALLLAACQKPHGSCTEDGDCLADEVCVDYLCRRVCNADRDCEPSEHCVEGACMPLQRPSQVDASRRDLGARPDASAPDQSSVDTVRDGGRLDAAGLDGLRADAWQPDTWLADTWRPDARQPDSGQADVWPPDARLPDGWISDTRQPDTWQPDAWQPDAWQPDTWRPDIFVAYDAATGDAGGDCVWSLISTGVSGDASIHDYGMVWTGSEIIIYGSQAGMLPGNNDARFGWRYSPGSRDGMPINSEDGPLFDNFYPPALWVASRLVILGEVIGTYGLSGGIYDPGTNTWTALAPSGLDSHISAHVAADDWVLVFTGYEQRGAVLDPITNSWDLAPFAQATYDALYAPSTRVVWTGHEAMVWDSLGAHGTVHGGRYHPAADVWTAMDTSGAMADRYSPTAVWSGAKMVIWGGYDGDSANPVLGTAYDPVADSWSSTSTQGAPPGRSNHLAVAHQGLMYVFGGFADGACQTTGGVYDPAFDAWTAMASENAPCLDSNAGNGVNPALTFWLDGSLYVMEHPSELWVYGPGAN